jgi:hypothetical protein
VCNLEDAMTQKNYEYKTKKISLEEMFLIYLNILYGIEYLHGL